jgi:hypothetical protein
MEYHMDDGPVAAMRRAGHVSDSIPVLKNLSDTLSVKDVVNDTVDVFGRELVRDGEEPTGKRREGVNPHKIPKPGGTREEGYAFTKDQGGYGGL